jgi:hypothetical protein
VESRVIYKKFSILNVNIFTKFNTTIEVPSTVIELDRRDHPPVLGNADICGFAAAQEMAIFLSLNNSIVGRLAASRSLSGQLYPCFVAACIDFPS